MAAVDGYVQAHFPEPNGLSDKEKDELWDWLGDG
jgi:hypothetical protein